MLHSLNHSVACAMLQMRPLAKAAETHCTVLRPLSIKTPNIVQVQISKSLKVPNSLTGCVQDWNMWSLGAEKSETHSEYMMVLPIGINGRYLGALQITKRGVPNDSPNPSFPDDKLPYLPRVLQPLQALVDLLAMAVSNIIQMERDVEIIQKYAPPHTTEPL